MIIATRTLQADTDTGPVPVEIRMNMPVEVAPDAYEVRYEIDFPEGTYRSVAGGFDAMQAVYLCQQKIGMELYMSDWHQSGRLAWIDGTGKSSGGYGFPVPRNFRDLLVGMDKEFEG